MARFILAPAAQRDIEEILAESQKHFGESARLRYEALLVQAIRDVVEDPDRAGSQSRPELAPRVRTYHLYFSRNRVSARAGRVRRPRHFLLYRTTPEGAVEIGRVLHDRMDLLRRLPEAYRSRTADDEEGPE
jgi:toxin ParE1/3/4